MSVNNKRMRSSHRLSRSADEELAYLIALYLMLGCCDSSLSPQIEVLVGINQAYRRCVHAEK